MSVFHHFLFRVPVSYAPKRTYPIPEPSYRCQRKLPAQAGGLGLQHGKTPRHEHEETIDLERSTSAVGTEMSRIPLDKYPAVGCCRGDTSSKVVVQALRWLRAAASLSTDSLGNLLQIAGTFPRAQSSPLFSSTTLPVFLIISSYVGPFLQVPAGLIPMPSNRTEIL